MFYEVTLQLSENAVIEDICVHTASSPPSSLANASTYMQQT